MACELACQSTAKQHQSVADENGNLHVDLSSNHKKESSESGNSPELLAASDGANENFNGQFCMDDLRRIGMKEEDVQMIVRKIAASRAGKLVCTDGQDSDAELHSDSVPAQTPQTPPKTPARGIHSTGTHNTEATLPSSITTDSHTEPVSAVPVPISNEGHKPIGGGQPSPIQLPPTSPLARGSQGPALSSRLNLDPTTKRENSFGSRTVVTMPTMKEEGPSQEFPVAVLGTTTTDIASPQLSQDSSACLTTPTTQLSKLGLTSPCGSGSYEEEAPRVHKPPPISALAGLDAISALCNLASTHRDTVDPSPRKRPRRNVERRNWSTLSSGSSDLGEAPCLDDDEGDAAASSVAKALAVAKIPSRETIVSSKVGSPRPAAIKPESHNALVALAMDRRDRQWPRDSDEDEEVETPEEEDEEWSPKDGDWSPKGRKIRNRTPKGSPRGPSRKGPRPFPFVARPALPTVSSGILDDPEEIELPVDIRKGGKVPELIRSKRAASGFVGVDFHEGKWRARVRIGIGIRGQPNRLVIGRYGTAGEAAIAYAKYVNSAAGKKMLAGSGATRG